MSKPPWKPLFSEQQTARSLMIDAVVMGVLDFIEDARPRPLGKRRWIDVDHGRLMIYVRFFHAPGYPRPRLEIANVSFKPRGKGLFTEVLERLEADGVINRYDLVAENVLNARFRQFFIRRGYEPIKFRDYCFILKTDCIGRKRTVDLPNPLTAR